MTAQYFPYHLRDIHGISTPTVAVPPSDPTTAMTYVISYPTGVHGIPCPVTGCPAVPVSRERMREHFSYRHPFDIIMIDEEGLLRQCPNCRKFLHSVNDAHLASRSCREKTLHFTQCNLAYYHQDLASKVSFLVDNVPIKNVSEFKYLGRVLDHTDIDDKAVTLNLKNARERWGRMVRILTGDGV
jgi:hypothetical protein